MALAEENHGVLQKNYEDSSEPMKDEFSKKKTFQYKNQTSKNMLKYL